MSPTAAHHSGSHIIFLDTTDKQTADPRYYVKREYYLGNGVRALLYCTEIRDELLVGFQLSSLIVLWRIAGDQVSRVAVLWSMLLAQDGFPEHTVEKLFRSTSDPLTDVIETSRPLSRRRVKSNAQELGPEMFVVVVCVRSAHYRSHHIVSQAKASETDTEPEKTDRSSVRPH